MQLRATQLHDADADADSADADFDGTDADATTHVGAHPRPLDVLTPFLKQFLSHSDFCFRSGLILICLFKVSYLKMTRCTTR